MNFFFLFLPLELYIFFTFRILHEIFFLHLEFYMNFFFFYL